MSLVYAMCRIQVLEEKNLKLEKRISTLESYIAELNTTLDTLTDKLIRAGVLVQRKGK